MWRPNVRSKLSPKKFWFVRYILFIYLFFLTHHRMQRDDNKNFNNIDLNRFCYCVARCRARTHSLQDPNVIWSINYCQFRFK